VILDQNYRSTRHILDGASALISRNESSRGKKLWTQNSKGEKLSFWHAGDDREEAEVVTREIRKLIDNGSNAADIAVLFRMNSQSRLVEQALVRANLKYEFIGGTRFFERREVKDILSYLKILSNPRDSISLKRVINTPTRGIGDATVRRLESEGHLWDGVSAFAGKNKNSKIAGFYAMIELLKEAKKERNVSEITKAIIEETGYFDYLKDDDPESAEERISNVEGLISDIRFQEEANPALSLQEYLEKASLHSAVDDLGRNGEPRVRLLTLHNAKGLEFPVVFITGMEEGVFPHNSSLHLSHELEEERRLAYVGMTRARERLYFTASRRRMMFGQWKGQSLSRFLSEIPPELFSANSGRIPQNPSSILVNNSASYSLSSPKNLPGETMGTMVNLKPGVEVRHQFFGIGKILAAEGSGISDFRLSIAFQKVGVKKILLQYASLRIINSKADEEVIEC
ncbi:ATP-binding domain-containing protein, partial [bacterium]|nr:ATP-binding domain-containing protein [bacterium]